MTSHLSLRRTPANRRNIRALGYVHKYMRMDANNQPMVGMGVPYVIEQTARGERSYDIWSRLLKDRIVFLGTEIDDYVARRWAALGGGKQ